MRAPTNLLVLVLVFTSAVVGAQAPATSFEVVSIKPSRSVEHGGGSSGPQPGGRFVMTNGPARVLLGTAYPGIREILGAPEWVTYDNYDVEARAGHDFRVGELAPLVRALLVDRFKLQAHVETRIRPIYELRMARPDRQPGPAMRLSTIDCDRKGACSAEGDAGLIESNGISMPAFVTWLPARVGRPVLDKTGLDGYFALQLRYSAPGVEDRPALPTALREQLGLALVPVDAPSEVLVVDRIERPTEN